MLYTNNTSITSGPASSLKGPGGAWLEVEDTGHGMPAAVSDRTFEPFFTTKAAGKGTGLGLSVVHGIVSQHGGTIAVNSREGVGSTMRIVLPRVGSAEHPAVPRSEAETGLPRGEGERILVVEDEEAAREGMREILDSLGYSATAVGSGGEAGRLPAAPAFDLLITDLMLPDVNGTALARSLTERWPGMRVVLMSGYSEDEAVRDGAGPGHVEFLQEPFDMARLAQTLHHVLHPELAGPR